MIETLGMGVVLFVALAHFHVYLDGLTLHEPDDVDCVECEGPCLLTDEALDEILGSTT